MTPFEAMCIAAIQTGRMVLDDVPARYRDAVAAALAGDGD